MLQLNNFMAWIVVDDVELPEYGVQYDSDRHQAACWIPSEAGKSFTICWRDPMGLVGTAGYLAVDGIPCGAKHMYSVSQRPTRRVDTIKKNTVFTSTITERPLIFAPLELTDNELYLEVPASPNLGEIRLDIFEVQIEGVAYFLQPGMPPDKQVLHERTKKAIEHRVKLGDESYCREKRFVTINKTKHLATFIFRYRPAELLKANGVIPPEISIKGRRRPLNEVIDLTEDWEGKEPKRIKTEIQGDIKAEKIKTEIKTELIMTESETKFKSEPDITREVKSEILVTSSQTSSFRMTHKEVIDLT